MIGLVNGSPPVFPSPHQNRSFRGIEETSLLNDTIAEIVYITNLIVGTTEDSNVRSVSKVSRSHELWKTLV